MFSLQGLGQGPPWRPWAVGALAQGAAPGSPDSDVGVGGTETPRGAGRQEWSPGRSGYRTGDERTVLRSPRATRIPRPGCPAMPGAAGVSVTSRPRRSDGWWLSSRGRKEGLAADMGPSQRARPRGSTAGRRGQDFGTSRLSPGGRDPVCASGVSSFHETFVICVG